MPISGRKGLRVSADLTLPVDMATKSTAILAQRRKGKSYTAAVLAEECVEAGVPFAIIDPTGAHWGLRSSADGKAAGLPVVILGGAHGDLPLERGAGRLVADLVVDHPGWYVLDVSQFESKEAERQFATDFADRLYRRKGQQDMDFVFLLIVDEADMFVPQRHDQGDNKMVGAFEAIVRRGGLRGLGTVLISQRAALVNKNVLEQLDVLICLRIVGPNDRSAVDDYVKGYAEADQRAMFLASLASLALGEAWVYEPGADLLQRVQIRERRTFNSSATPKPGERRVEPSRLADVDLAAVKEQMGETIERAKADDPKELRRRIAELERQLRAKPAAEPVERVVEKPVPDPKVLEALSSVVRLIEVAAAGAADVCDGILADRDATSAVEVLPAMLHTGVTSGPKVLAPMSHPPATRATTGSAPSNEGPEEEHPAGGPTIKKGAWRILGAMVRHHPTKLTRSQIGAVSGFKISGGTFGTYWSTLKRAGFIDEQDGLGWATEEGIIASGETPSNPTTTDEVRAMWHSALKAGARSMLDVLIDAYPTAVSREELGVAVKMEPSGGTFGTYLSTLRRNNLVTVDGPWITARADTLMLGD